MLYVGKARSLQKRVVQYAKPLPHPAHRPDGRRDRGRWSSSPRETETEALLLEINLIKQLKPRFNVLLRDDKSFPEILSPPRPPGPAAAQAPRRPHRSRATTSAPSPRRAVNRTLNTLQKAFLLRSCSDSVYESRTRPCMLHQIKRCSAPCIGLIGEGDYGELVEEAELFLRGKIRAVQAQLAEEMQAASRRDGVRARRRACATASARCPPSPGEPGINPETVEEADVFALHPRAARPASRSSSSAPARTGATAPTSRAPARAATPGEILDAFLGQFYDDKPIAAADPRQPRPATTPSCWPRPAARKGGRKVEIGQPQRGEKARARRARPDQRPRGAGPEDGRERGPGEAAGRASARPSAWTGRPSGSRSTTTPTSWAPTPSAA